MFTKLIIEDFGVPLCYITYDGGTLPAELSDPPEPEKTQKFGLLT